MFNWHLNPGHTVYCKYKNKEPVIGCLDNPISPKKLKESLDNHIILCTTSIYSILVLYKWYM